MGLVYADLELINTVDIALAKKNIIPLLVGVQPTENHQSYILKHY